MVLLAFLVRASSSSSSNGRGGGLDNLAFDINLSIALLQEACTCSILLGILFQCVNGINSQSAGLSTIPFMKLFVDFAHQAHFERGKQDVHALNGPSSSSSWSTGT
jgi:hypothetical protein